MMSIRQLQCIFAKVFLCPCYSEVFTRSSGNVAVDDISIIKFPISLRKKLIYREKTKIKGKSSTSGSLQLARPGKIMISGDKKSHAMYTDEYCTKFKPPVLTSSTWTSRRSPGRHFTIHPIKENPSLNTTATFEELELSKEIIEALRINSIEAPTVIQAKAISPILSGNNVMLAAETGCGKTFAYLLPVLQRMLASKRKNNLAVPRVLVLVPTQELVKQVSIIIQDMGSNLDLPVKYLSLSSSDVTRYTKPKNFSTCDVVVGTPSLILNAISRRKLHLGDFECAILDECDTLLDNSFVHSVTAILKHFNIQQGLSKPVLHSHSVQLILSSATYPEYAKTALQDVISDEKILSVRSGYLHRVSPHIKHRFLRVRPSHKLERIVGLVENETPTIVFCNFQKTALELHRSMQEQAIPSVLFDSALKTGERSRRLREFINGEYNLVVATDLLSRGLDTKRIRHVINYEVPNSVSDYIHRCGRVGRVGQPSGGLVTTLVSRKWEIDIVKHIEEAARRREEISTVDANIKQRHTDRWQEDIEP